MAEETKLSPEGEALAEAFGAMLAGFAARLHLDGAVPKHVVSKAISDSIGRTTTGRSLTSPADLRAAIAAAVKRTAIV